jgi:hypothetical protein
MRPIDRWSGFPCIAREQFDKLRELFGVKTKIRWELPEKRAKLLPEQQNSRSQEIRQGAFRFFQPQDMRDVPRPFYGKLKIGRSRRSPTLEAGRPLQRIKCPIDFDGRKLLRRITQFLALR